ncbi:hypothetical protein BKI52_42650 [marine bacterium AO1-C]|nr:hypothetical protein BKI52_42650 [marine bacterium AO1-C]
MSVHSFGALWLFIDLHWQRSQMQQQIHAEQIPTQFLTVISLTNQEQHSGDFEWVDEEEFRYQGNLYDIVKIVAKGEVTQYYCIWDKYEEKLQETLRHQVASQTPLSQESKIALNQVFDKIWLSGQAIVFCTAPNFHQLSITPNQMATSVPVRMQEVPIPPPQV